jgi:hypothetical protein
MREEHDASKQKEAGAWDIECNSIVVLPKRISWDLEKGLHMKDSGAYFEIMIWP